MTTAKRLGAVLSFALVCGYGTAVAQEATGALETRLSAAEMETFLRDARIVRTRVIGEGVTGSLRATLTNGALTHDAHVQTIDQSLTVFRDEVNFRDSYRYNIAAYRLAVLLGLDNVPMSVERWIDRKPASITWWIDDRMMDEGERQEAGATDPDVPRAAEYHYRRLVFDELIQNRDRNVHNLIYSTDWTMWMIDHTRAFRLRSELMEPEKLLRVERTLFEKLKALTAEALVEIAGTTLTKDEVNAVIARRDAIVRLFGARIATYGTGAVVYSRPAAGEHNDTTVPPGA